MSDIAGNVDAVSGLIREIATEQVLARFRSLDPTDIDEKSPGDLVTVADRECERVLGGALRSISDVPVVGEEAAEADPGLVAAIDACPAAWVVDPIDGTANFVAGSGDFAVMVAYVESGVATAAWIWLPTQDRMVTATRGGGAWSNGEPVRVPAGSAVGGIIKSRYVPEPQKTAINAVRDRYDREPDRRCAGVEYLAMIDGDLGFLTYWRTKPWDHAPGTLVAIEAGLRSGRFDGSAYRPGDGRDGLLTAAPDLWAHLGADLDAAVRAR